MALYSPGRVTVSAACCDPVLVGRKAIVTEQLAPAAMVALQVLA